MKALGPDRIQNWIWSSTWDCVGKHILHLFMAVTILGHIPARWKTVLTLIILKLGKPNYTIAGAFRPIALLNPIGVELQQFLAVGRA
ncbi:hypothetical protein CROQUDRAFT_53480 [Cronartium quercuum f. sp. fusiforme G11]|uniref:Uncharacterized protein n=1 Tax=Cronartium quercuum f. sp. fusiforme G11 TaxID=708437 RepID=A0A9P6NAH8_9BASI|nr:hypothetical protein CROQUDRAFT_53480 [Cronartium quercuum f. sp. fusiforme G11]